MKKKIYKLMGVALVVVLLASLTVGLAAPMAADPGTLKWTKVPLPKVEAYQDDWTYFNDIEADEFATSEGDFWATPGIDLGPIAISPDGDTLFAAVADGFYLGSDWYHVLKSTDGGYSWVVTGLFDDFGISEPIVDIVVSPDYEEDTTVTVATEELVYQSVDGGKRFAQMVSVWGDEDISDLDVALDDRGRLAYMVGTDSDVYVAAVATGNAWQEQEIDAEVLACAFTPNFADDEGICAVVTDDGETWMSFSFGYIGEDNPEDGWGVDIADAPFTNAEGTPFDSEYARIAFPDDFDPWGIGNNVCFVGIATHLDAYLWYDLNSIPTDDGSDAYKVVLKESGTSSAIDLDIRGVITTLLPTATPITSIDVCGDAEEATIIVGTDNTNLGDTPESFFVYYSTDSGENWDAAAKPPTGGTRWEWVPDNPGDWYFGGVDDLLAFLHGMTRVLMAPDFCDSGIAYASTWGLRTDAFSRTSDAGDSWNQISIIDYGSRDIPTLYATLDPEDEDYGLVETIEEDVAAYAVVDLEAAGYNAADILHMTTQTPQGYTQDEEPVAAGPYYGAVWKRTGGKNWERIWSYANAGVTDAISEQIITSDEAMFAIDYDVDGNGKGWIWRSSDNGATWPKKISTKDALSEVVIVSPTTLYTGHGNGEVWWSTKSGTGWTKPDDSEIPTVTVIYMVVAGDMVLVGTLDGMVFVSSDGGETIEKVGLTDPGVTGPPALATFGFGTTDIIYAAIPMPDGGIWRCEVDYDDPGAAEWERIDDNQDSTGAVVYNEETVIADSPAIPLPPSGVLYVIDKAAVVDDDVAGGLWRSTNPTADVDGPVPPYWETENKGLDTDDSVGLKDLDVFPTVVFCINYSATDYWEQIVMFTDTLDSGVPLAMPAEDATGVGLLPAGGVYPKVNLAWESMAGANSYQYQAAIDSDFMTVVASGFTTSLATPPIQMDPNMTYYWRVRVAKEGSLEGAPLISPWSATWKFKTAIGATMARPDLEAPWSGEPDVPLDPTFEWSGIEWAEVYDFELATDPATTAGGYFTAPLKALIGTEALVSTAWKCDIALEYETRYYWHVKAFGVDTETPWSDVGTFTTMSVPPEPVEPGPPIVVPPQEVITPAWIWAIVIIGAILVIAVIVLIVTTRRVP